MPDLYLRKWRVLVSDDNGIALDVSDLRCAFIIEKRAIQAVNYADITIFNLNAETENVIIQSGARVVVEAGYENGQYGVVFDGEVFQPVWGRENVIDMSLTLHCIDGDSFLHQNFAAFAMSAGYDYRGVIASIAANARVKMPVGHVTEGLAQQQAPRGRVVFGDPKRYLRTLAKANQATFFVNDGEVQVMKLSDVPDGEALVISPETGLVGTPEQTEYGFRFRSLLNPSIRLSNPPMLVKLENSALRQQKAVQGQRISMIDQDMIGQVIGTVVSGDTRGGEWYTDAVCVTRGGKSPLQLATLPEMMSNGGVDPT